MTQGIIKERTEGILVKFREPIISPSKLGVSNSMLLKN